MRFNEIQLTRFSLKKDVIRKGDCFILSFPLKPPSLFFLNYLSHLNICGAGTENQFSALSFSKQKMSVTKGHRFLPLYHKSPQVLLQ